MAKSGTIIITQGTQNVANNTTSITVAGIIKTSGESWRGNSRTGTISVTQGGIAIYSGSFTHGAPANTETTLFTISLTVKHKDDGSSGTIAASYNYDSGWCSASTSKTLTTIPRASVPSCITWPDTTYDVGDIGNTITIHMNKKAAFTHTVKYVWGTQTGIIGNNIVDNVSWTIPESLISEIPNSSSGVGSIVVDTYNGTTLIGSKTTAFKANVPENVGPTAVVELQDIKGYLVEYGKYIQGKSKIQVVVTAEGIYGSTIKSYRVTFDGKTYTDEEFTTDVIVGKGALSFVAVVTDTRERTFTIEKSLDVYEYNPPKINEIKAKRCQEYNANESGDKYLGVIFSSEVVSLDNQNSVKYELDYKKTTEETYVTKDITAYDTNQYLVTNGSTTFEADNDAYDIILRITDNFNSVEKKLSGPSLSVLISKLKYNLGIAFGKLAELEGVLDIGFRTCLSGGILQPTLKEGSDFYEQKTPNTFTLKDISSAGYLHCPVSEGKGSLKVEECGEGSIHLMFKLFDKIHPLIYECTYSDDEWSEWVLTNGDYIIEQGTNGIWTYEKWASGKLEMWSRTYVNCEVNTAQNNIYRSEIQYIGLPFTVYNMAHQVTCTDHNSWASSSYHSTTSTSLGVVIWRGGTYSSYNWNLNLLVKGRWK